MHGGCVKGCERNKAFVKEILRENQRRTGGPNKAGTARVAVAPVPGRRLFFTILAVLFPRGKHS